MAHGGFINLPEYFFFPLQISSFLRVGLIQNIPKKKQKKKILIMMRFSVFKIKCRGEENTHI